MPTPTPDSPPVGTLPGEMPPDPNDTIVVEGDPNRAGLQNLGALLRGALVAAALGVEHGAEQQPAEGAERKIAIGLRVPPGFDAEPGRHRVGAGPELEAAQRAMRAIGTDAEAARREIAAVHALAQLAREDVPDQVSALLLNNGAIFTSSSRWDLSTASSSTVVM